MGRIADFDFARAGAGIPLLSWLLLLAGVLAGIVVAERYDALAEEGERLTRQLDRLERKANPPVARRAPAAQKSAPAERNESAPFPWEIVLRELEQAVDKRVALLALDTERATARTRLVAEARAIGDALDFAARLRDSPATRRVLLLAHETRQTPAGAVTGFTLQIEWKPE